MRGRRLAIWPWLVLVSTMVPAVGHYLAFEHEIDGEYPQVIRPTFSPHPPAAYRLAEPGDTIDRVALYVSATCVVISGFGLLAAGRGKLWASGLAVSLAGGWVATTPSPCYDGWHGLGFAAILHPDSSLSLRIGLIGVSLALICLAIVPLIVQRHHLFEFFGSARQKRAFWLFVVAAACIPLRFLEVPALEPVGYWPRWFFDWGLIAFGLGMVKLAPPLPAGWRGGTVRLAAVGVLGALIVGGIRLTWYHRPLERLHAVVPGKIYISAMPTYEGLKIEQERLHFKTVINLFPEDTYQRSPHLEAEIRFLQERGIRFLRSPGTAIDSDEFLDETLRIAQDPSAWPILVHCHGCMDRSPAWMGIYRFVVQGKPLREIMQEIEDHRGCRPKASVTLLYNRVLAPRAPDRYALDPAARLLTECALGTANPYDQVKKTQATAVRKTPLRP